MNKNILTINDIEEAKKHIGYPCLLSDEYFAICNFEMDELTISILRKVDEQEYPFFDSENGFRYCLPISKEYLDEVEELEKRFNLEQLYVAIKYKMEVKNVQE